MGEKAKCKYLVEECCRNGLCAYFGGRPFDNYCEERCPHYIKSEEGEKDGD